MYTSGSPECEESFHVVIINLELAHADSLLIVFTSTDTLSCQGREMGCTKKS